VPKIAVTQKTPSLDGSGFGGGWHNILVRRPELSLPPPPQPSPIEVEGALAIFHATLKMGMMVLGAKAISVFLYSNVSPTVF